MEIIAHIGLSLVNFWDRAGCSCYKEQCDVLDVSEVLVQLSFLSIMKE